MATFTPPIVKDIPPISYERNADRVAWRLFRHYGPRPRGVNVYYLTNGVATATQPEDDTDIAKIWFGGSGPYPVTATEAAALTAAGFTVT